MLESVSRFCGRCHANSNGIITRDVKYYRSPRPCRLRFNRHVFLANEEMSMAIKIPSPIGATAGAVDETMARPGRCVVNRRWCQRRNRASQLQILPRRVRSPPVCVDVSRGISSDMYARKSSHDVHETAVVAPRATFDGFDVGEFDLSICLSRTLDTIIRRD